MAAQAPGGGSACSPLPSSVEPGHWLLAPELERPSQCQCTGERAAHMRAPAVEGDPSEPGRWAESQFLYMSYMKTDQALFF